MKADPADRFWRRPLPAPSCRYRPWLAHRGSLTRRLQERCPAFGVRKVGQRLARACRDERAVVGVGATLALTREVYLHCGDTPVVFAHTVARRESLRGPWANLRRLGSRPLGAALFADPLVRRAPLRYRRLDRRDELYRRACRALAARPARLWARRSLFTRRGAALLVTEVFLPGILDLP